MSNILYKTMIGLIIIGVLATSIAIIPLHKLRINAKSVESDYIFHPGLYNHYKHLYINEIMGLTTKRFIYITKSLILIVIYSFTIVAVLLAIIVYNKFIGQEYTMNQIFKITSKAYPVLITIGLLLIEYIGKLIISVLLSIRYWHKTTYNIIDNLLPFYRLYTLLFIYANESNNTKKVKMLFILSLINKIVIILLWISFIYHGITKVYTI